MSRFIIILTLTLITLQNTFSQDNVLSSRRVSVQWAEVPLRQGVMRLAEVYDFGVWLDRRVDSSITIQIEASQELLGEFVKRLAAENNLDVTIHESIIYIGLPKSVTKLQQLLQYQRQQAKQLPDAMLKKLVNREATKYPILTEPSRLLKTLVTSSGCKLTDEELLPPDLWDSNKLPPLPLSDRLTLLLYGFDLTYTIDSDKHELKLQPIDSIKLLNEIEKIQHKQDKNDNSTKEKQQTKPPTLSQLRFTIKVQDHEAKQLLTNLAAKLELEIVFDEESLKKKNIDLNKRISMEVKDATSTILFRAATKPLGATFKIKANTITIY
ncbi:MAG: hypothetical protein LBU65_00840 [Planctomycetaceae bacterium]|jgi:hypothetical protein|nr:hypothetical protein [Planctomycetaceae bacterium]